MSDDDETITDIAAELYSIPPAAFIAQRDVAAKAAPDPEVATRVRALKKPSIAAWVVNLFASERAEMLDQALALADELREAQADLDAAALSALGRERRTLTQRLAEQAAELAEARGERVTASTLEAVRQTLSAAFFDPSAAAAVASGRLVRELEPSAALPVDFAGVVGGGMPDAPRTATPPVDDLRARRERKAAERALSDAEARLTRAERTRTGAERSHREAMESRERLSRRARELEEELARVAAALAHAEEEIAEAAQVREESDRNAETARNQVDEARTALEALRAPGTDG